MPLFTAPGATQFEMRTNEPASSVVNVFRQPPVASSGDASSAVRYHEYGGVEVLGAFVGADIFGWPLEGTITTIRYYVLGTPGDPTSRQLLYEVTGGAWDVAAFRYAVQQEALLFNLLTAGDDRLEGGSGEDDLVGGMGDDLYILGSMFDWAHEFAGGGYDTVQVDGSYALYTDVERLILTGTGGHTGVGNHLANEIIGNSGGNRMDGGLNDDVLRGEGGDDLLFGGGGADLLIGSTGDDNYYLDNIGDQVVEAVGEGFDRLFTSVDFTLAAGVEIEHLIATSDTGVRLTGNAFDNWLRSGDGDDILDGGAGRDRVDFYDAVSGVTVNLTAGTAVGQGTDTLIGIENVLGSAFDDQIDGDHRANELRGSGGDDVILGRSGDDVLIGGDGDDVLEGGGGYDELRGGDGMDTARFATASGPVLVDLVAGLSLGHGFDRLISIERVIGSRHDDWLIGGAGDEHLSGAQGDDQIGGGEGNDRLTGGAGDDLFYFEGASGRDVIVDFVAGAGSEDQIALDPSWFADFADVLLHTTDTAGGAVISKSGVVIRLVGVTKAQLHEDDFLFCGCDSGGAPADETGGPTDDAGPTPTSVWGFGQEALQPDWMWLA